MTTIAEKMVANATRNGQLVTVTREATEAEGEVFDPLTNEVTPGTPASTSWTVYAGEADPADDQFAADKLILRNPIDLIIPNAPAITFAPEPGMRLAATSVDYTIARAKPRVLKGAVQYWRVVGGV